MTITDVLETRLQVVGLGQYVSSFQQLTRALGVASRGMNEAATAELAVATATGAASLAITAGLSKATVAAGEHQATLVRAAASFQQFGQSIPQQELEAWSNTVQDATGIARDQVVSIAGLYAEYGLTTQQAERFTKATLEASVALKAQGTSAEQIARFVGTVVEMSKEGNTRGVSLLARRIGLVVDEARAAADPLGAIMDALTKKGGQQAEERLRTLPGAMDAFRASVTRLGQDVGKYFLPPVTAMVRGLTALIDALDRVPGAVAAVSTVLAVGLGARAITGVIGLMGAVRGLIAGGAGTGAVAGLATAAGLAPSGLGLGGRSLIAAQAAAAGGGLGARALGLLGSGFGMAGGLTAGGAILSSIGGNRTDPTGRFLRGLGGSAIGGGIGAAIGFGLGGPLGAIGLGTVGAGIGADLAGQSIQSDTGRGSALQDTAQAVQSLSDVVRDMLTHVKSIDEAMQLATNLSGNRDAVSALGGARILAAFARGIA